MSTTLQPTATETQLRKRVEDLLIIVGNSLKKELAIVLEAQAATIANQKHIAKLRSTIDVLQTRNQNLLKGDIYLKPHYLLLLIIVTYLLTYLIQI